MPNVEGSVFISQWFIDPLVRGQHVHEYVGGCHRNLRHHLERIGEAHEPRAAPMCAQRAGRRGRGRRSPAPWPSRAPRRSSATQGTKMVSRKRAGKNSVLQGSCMPKAWTRPRVPSCSSRGTNCMRCARMRHDARQEDLAAARARQVDAAARCPVPGACEAVQADAFARREPVGGGDAVARRRSAARTRASGASARRCALREGGVLGFVVTKRGRKSATRECRCESLLSNQSNKVGPTLTFKAFRTERTCTVLSARHSPGRLHYGREEPDPLSNTPGSAR